jgi:hypothetical protein
MKTKASKANCPTFGINVWPKEPTVEPSKQQGMIISSNL